MKPVLTLEQIAKIPHSHQVADGIVHTANCERCHEMQRHMNVSMYGKTRGILREYRVRTLKRAF